MMNFALPGLMEISRPQLDAQRALLELPPHWVQDGLWAGIVSVGPVRPGGTQPLHALVSVQLAFGKQLPVGPSPDYECRTDAASGQGSIILSDANTWIFSIPAQPLPLPCGSYYWEIRTTDTTGAVTVHYAGKQLVTA